MSTKIYTRTGDKGQTRLLGGKRVAKSDPRIDACGNLDELNAWLGLLSDLFAAQPGGQASVGFIRPHPGAVVHRRGASRVRTGRENKIFSSALSAADVTTLETAIDKMETSLPALKNFILPGGHTLVSQIHITRSVCRKAERSAVSARTTGTRRSTADPAIPEQAK